MLLEIRELGFEYAELSHNTRLSLVPGILDCVKANEIKICSLHNFCPLPVGVLHSSPNLFQFTSPDPRERQQAWRYTLQTLDFAQQVGARFVIIHLGSVEMRSFTDRLVDLVSTGQGDGTKYQRLRYELEEIRLTKKEPFEGRAMEILFRLAEEAKQRGLVLAIENREKVEEIPFEDDLPFYFLDLPDVVRYWHDVGHAQIKHNLGLVNHALFLESMLPYLAGFHVHDVVFPASDHRPPGTGSVDFYSLRPFVAPEHPKVLELHPQVTADQVRSSVEYLQNAWGKD